MGVGVEAGGGPASGWMGTELALPVRSSLPFNDTTLDGHTSGMECRGAGGGGGGGGGGGEDRPASRCRGTESALPVTSSLPDSSTTLDS